MKKFKSIYKVVLLTVAILPVAELMQLLNHGVGY